MDYEKLLDAGIDASEAIEKRFLGNEELYRKMLVRFPDDKNFELLESAVSQNDRKAALAASHTLKGTCGNFSMNVLFSLFSEQVRLFREEKWEDACGMMPEITEKYLKVIDAINELRKS